MVASVAVPDIQAIASTVTRMRETQSERDGRYNTVRLVRGGKMAQVFPQAFSDDFPHSVAANFIDVAARDLAELIAPLPTLGCSAGNATSRTAKDFATKKTNIGLYYWHCSQLDKQMFGACDRYVTYGALPIIIEPDWDEKTPRIYADDPTGAYWLLDRYGNVRVYAKVYRMRAEELAAMFPEAASRITPPPAGIIMLGQGANDKSKNEMLEVVRYMDAKAHVMFVPSRHNLVLSSHESMTKRVPVVIAQRPSLDGETRGQFDDAIYVQMARAKMALLGLEAAEKSVQAPLALPDDVNQLAVGPDAVIRSRTPEKIRRVGLELSPGALQHAELLEQELRTGTRYPEGRSGDSSASVITGRGVQALLGTIDTQVKTAQAILGHALAKATSIALEMDEALWGNVRKDVGTVVWEGQSFDLTYTPSKDIKGDYAVDCTYGFAAGLGANQATVMIEQMIAAKLIDRGTGRRHLPLGEDVTKLERAVEVEQMRDALQQAMLAMGQSLNVLAEQGMDPGPQIVRLASIVQDLQKGTAIEDAISAAFAPPPQQGPPDDGGLGGPGGPPGGGDGGAPAGMQDTNGLPMGTAVPGQAPGGRPPLQMLMAGLSPAGKANLSDNVAQRAPAA